MMPGKLLRLWKNNFIPHNRNFSTKEKFVDVSINEKTGFSTLTMKRPRVNSLNLALLQELNDTLTGLEKDNCRGLIITSEFPTVFCAGLDITELYKPKKDHFRVFWNNVQDMWLNLHGCSYPTVAAINGHSPAGGCLIALSCEYRVMVGPQYTIGLNETRVGITAPKWLEKSMLSVLSRRDTELALTEGKLFSTDEAFKVGLIDEIAAHKEDAITKAEKCLIMMSKIPAMARKRTKLSFRKEDLEWMIENREKDLEQFWEFVIQPEVQNNLELYLNSLKKNKQK